MKFYFWLGAPRLRKRINEILEEQEFGRSGFIDEKTAIEVGKLLGAHLIAFIEEVEILFKGERLYKLATSSPLSESRLVHWFHLSRSDLQVNLGFLVLYRQVLKRVNLQATYGHKPINSLFSREFMIPVATCNPTPGVFLGVFLYPFGKFIRNLNPPLTKCV